MGKTKSELKTWREERNDLSSMKVGGWLRMETKKGAAKDYRSTAKLWTASRMLPPSALNYVSSLLFPSLRHTRVCSHNSNVESEGL